MKSLITKVFSICIAVVIATYLIFLREKAELIYLLDILNTYTDDEHALSMSEIIAKLAACGVNAERKSLYTDIEELRHYGADIIGEKDGSSYTYRIGNRKFEIAEVKLLCENDMAGVTIDRFGKSTPFLKQDENHFIAIVSVAVSVQFLGWIMVWQQWHWGRAHKVQRTLVLSGPERSAERMQFINQENGTRMKILTRC